MRDLLLSIDGSDFINSFDVWTESTVDAEDLIIYNSCQSQVIKNISAVAPYIKRSELSEAFIIESVNLGDLA
jgi:hypothetical protein